MYMRAVTFRIVYLGIMSAGILLSSFLRDSTVQAAPVGSAAAVAKPAAPHIVTLATVHVSATARHVAARAPALARAAAHVAAGNADASDEHSGAATLPTLRLDMPYYAFGKLLPRVGKE